MAILNKYKDFIGEKWVDGNWQDDNHPIDDEDILNIFTDYLDHFSLHEGFEVVKNFTAEHLNKYVFHAKKELAFDELLLRKHFLVVIKFKVFKGDVDFNGFHRANDDINKYAHKKYIDDASDLILDISERVEDLGYYLRYPDIKIFNNFNYNEIVFRFSKMDSQAKRYKERGEFGGYQATMESKISIPSLEDVKNIFTDFLDKHDIHNSKMEVSGDLVELRKEYVKKHRYKSLKDKKKRLDILNGQCEFRVEFEVPHEQFSKMFNWKLHKKREENTDYSYLDRLPKVCEESEIKLKSDEEFMIACERLEDDGFKLKNVHIYWQFDSMTISVLFSNNIMIKESKKEIKNPIKIYKRLGEDENDVNSYIEEIVDESEIKGEFSKYIETSRSLMKEYPDFRINHRGNQFFDIWYKNKVGKDSDIWIGCYDIIMKEFVLFVAGSVDDYHRRKTTIERCMEGEEMDEGFERFVWLWMEIRDEII